MSSAPAELKPISVRVQAVRLEAEGIFSFELRPLAGETLPTFSAGAHLDLILPSGLERSYSLLNPSSETGRYVIAVKREAESRGGSAFLCEILRVGDVIGIKPPLNTFELDESAIKTVFIGGGIGITPLLSMMHRLDEVGRPWQLFFSASRQSEVPFLGEITAFERRSPGRTTMWFGDSTQQDRFVIDQVIAGFPPGTHFYCCGPARMLRAFQQATTLLPPDHVHSEYFTSDQPVALGGFEVVLARSGKAFRIPADKTILETLLAEGMNLPRSCMQGVCGTCETVVLEGVPDHRDHVLSERERRSNRKMMICRSGCIGDRLVLDL